MPVCVHAFCKTLAALAAVAAIAPVSLGGAAPLPALSARLEQHALMLAASARATDAPTQSARYIEVMLASQGHAVSRRNYLQQRQLVHHIEVTVSNPASAHRPARVLVIGASHVPRTTSSNSETAAVIELARLLKGVRPAEGTELKFVFFVSGVSPDTGNFLAFAGTRGAAELVRKTLASFRAASTFPAEGLAAPAYIEGVTLAGHASRRRYGDPALMITDIAFLHYPYSHTAQREPPRSDYAGMARSVGGLAKLVAGMAAPASM